MPLLVPLSPIIFARGDAGVPTTTVCDLQVAGRIDAYEHAITAHGGFENCRMGFVCDLDEAIDWLANGLMRSVVVYGPDAEVCWEGVLVGVTATLGQEQRTLSMEKLANHVTVAANFGGTPAYGAASDATSIATYGTKQSYISVDGMDFNATAALAAVELARRKNPQAVSRTRIDTGGTDGEVYVELLFVGWYYTLDWLLGLGTVAGSTVTTTQVGTILASAAAVNAFVSSSTADIPASGLSTYAAVAADVTYRQRIDQLLAIGNSSNQRYAWGVYEGRTLQVAVWAGDVPTTTTYQRYLGDATLYDATGNAVAPWNARPNAMYAIADLLDVSAVSAALDAAARSYVERVVCRVDASIISLTLEPFAEDSADVRMANINI